MVEQSRHIFFPNEKLKGCGVTDYLFLEFNYTENELLDHNHAEPLLICQCALGRLVCNHSLVDVWRRMLAGCRLYTWSQHKDSRISFAHLDHISCFPHHFNAVKICKIKILPVGFTDHSSVECNVSFTNILPKSACWPFNSPTTANRYFRETFRFYWSCFKQRKSDFSSLSDWCDHGKVQSTPVSAADA